ncbi:proteobacterial dedicated sortase system histidine kinase [Photobacterium jeanii]|uniref:histidine kinase n=1 Tax=Photobacterium jeanii TaxID=858640 RepID=A0A178K4U8_9GAMM|nr:proteobacterial dedicated sortase system histidine kinase [Photobacterium jeanii]OAN11723.1 proteobacterial dedicated sortase system histidine kinase [Photobacterium jeanii]PST91259.1 proteobacterial dedicated sortase system histidine kinase [Photobacterium jeanii]
MKLKLATGLRTKVILISSLLLALPWLGYKYVWEMEKLLRQGQEQTLIGTTRAVATALNERPNLFNDQASFLSSVKLGRDLYAYELHSPIQLDGQLSDWQNFQSNIMDYGREFSQYSRRPYSSQSLSFRHIIGKYQGHLYAMFEVKDAFPVMRRKNSLRVNRNDHLIIGLTSPDGSFHRYVIAAHQDGWVNAFEVQGDISVPANLTPANHIQGFWRTTEQGYNIELRLPLNELGSKLGFAFYDVNNASNRMIDGIIGTSNTNQADRLGTVLIPSPEIDNILKGLGHTSSRIMVIDRHQRVLAQSGDIQDSNGVWSTSIKYDDRDTSWWSKFEEAYLHPIYYKFFITEPTSFSDQEPNAALMKSVPVAQALQGRGYSQWRMSSDGKALILSAAYPIWLGNQVMGAVIAEESTIGIQMLRNRALEQLFNVFIAIISIGTITLFLFASNISSRIRRLRDEAEHAIDSQGRIKQSMDASQDRDEIGDLSRSLSAMVGRLGQYHHYLEHLSSRLSHELRTPVAVVRSSLENLSMHNTDPDSQRYIERAENGIHRLSSILSSMTEATRIEQSIQGAEKERFPLNELVSGCLQGYQMAFPHQTFEVKVPEQAVMIDGAPDYLAQLLDKLVANAEEFSEDKTAIEVQLATNTQEAVLTVSNRGPLLPENMANQLLNSMVSIRSQEKKDKPHLGLGLYIARLITDYHQGDIAIRNRHDNLGVEVEIKLPLCQAD